MYERGRNLASHQAVSSHYETVKYQSEQLEQFMETLSSVENDVVDLIRSNKNSSLPQEVRCRGVFVLQRNIMRDELNSFGGNRSLYAGFENYSEVTPPKKVL